MPDPSSRFLPHPPRSLVRKLALALGTVAASAGCSGDDPGPVAPGPTEPPPADLVGDPVAGAEAFLVHCTTCHTTTDAFDLAHFEYPPRDIIRRALGHVDSTTSLDINAFVRSLEVPRATPRVAPFQPGGKTLLSDGDFWKRLFGTDGWPAGLTAETLRSIDPRAVPVPLDFALWSREDTDEDWLPDMPLPARVLEYGGGALTAALDGYYAAPGEPTLVAALEAFHASSKGPGGICSEADPTPCFDARRWMSSLAAQHYLRSTASPRPPVEVAQVWWDVGRSAIAQQSVARTPEDRDRAFRNGSRWMYLGYAFAPEAFEEPAGYMGTFLIGSQGLRRVATFAALRRMVGNGRAHRSNPLQYFHDGRLAAQRAPPELELDVGLFTLQHFVDRLETDGRPSGLQLAQARSMVTGAWNAVRGSMWRDAGKAARINQLRDQVLQLLQ